MNIIEEKYLEDLSRDDFVKLMQKQYFSEKNLQVESVKNGIVLPPQKFKTKIKNKLGFQQALHGKGGVINSENKYIELSAQKAKGMRNRVYGCYEINAKNIKKRDEKVIYLNYFIKQWGHFLLDVVGRLWYPLHHDKNTKIVYTSYTGTDVEINDNYLEFFSLLGIDKSRLVMINEPTQFDEVIIPESSILPGEYYTKEYKDLFNAVVSNVLIDNEQYDRRIYCSRAKLDLARSKEFGEGGIEKIFLKNGFEPIYMETLSLTDQIKALNSARSVVLTSGSLAHNLLFINKKIDVYILNKTYRVNLHQFLINDISGANIRFVDIYRAPVPILYGFGPFLMDLTLPLITFLDKNNFTYEKTPILDKKDYFKFYFRWLWTYKFFIFRINSIKEGNNEFEKEFKIIRKFYKLGKNI